MNGCPTVLRRFDDAGSSEQLGAFPHTDQSQAVPFSPGLHRVVFIKPFPVVLDNEFHLPAAVAQRNGHQRGAGMLGDIGEGFLADVE